jgi:hypothetical protein
MRLPDCSTMPGFDATAEKGAAARQGSPAMEFEGATSVCGLG